MSDPENSTEQEKEKLFTMKEFFESVAPCQVVTVSDLARKTGSYIGDNDLTLPVLNLHCPDENCNGPRLFERGTSYEVTAEKFKDIFIEYRCKNCSNSVKTYAIYVLLSKDRSSGYAYKYGEMPEFGPQTPARVAALLGNEREYYFKGRRAENQGLGIAAFAYYRRVVENQKNKIFDEIIKTVKQVDPSNTELLQELENAKKETQFTKAVESVKHGIPQTLLIRGHNPLTLLHSALSDGLHAKTDEECLELATSIRVILADFADRVSSALKDTDEIKTALSKLLKRSNPTPSFES